MEYFLGHGQPKLQAKLVWEGKLHHRQKAAITDLESSSRDKFQTLSCLPALSRCGLCDNHQRKVLKAANSQDFPDYHFVPSVVHAAKLSRYQSEVEGSGCLQTLSVLLKNLSSIYKLATENFWLLFKH